MRVKSVSLEEHPVGVSKAKGSITPGDDVEAWCTRCRMDLNHRVIAVVGSNIQRVHCLTCGGDHKYYPPKGQASEKTETVRARGTRSTAKNQKLMPEKISPARAAGEWSAIMKDMSPDTAPTPYNVRQSFRPSEFIEHPVFGTGRVMEIVGAERIQVIFKDGRKVLICNKKTP